MHSKGLLMKDLLVCTRPSYQHLLMKLSCPLLRCSTFWFFLLKTEKWSIVSISCSLSATLLSGLLDQNKLKKSLWTVSVFNLSPPHLFWLWLCFSGTHSHSFSVMFILLKKVHVQRTKKTRLVHYLSHVQPLTSTLSWTFTPLTCPLPPFKRL